MNQPLSSVTPEENRHGNMEANTAILEALNFALMAHAPEVHQRLLATLSAQAPQQAKQITSPGAKAVFKQRIKFMTGKDVMDL